MKISEGNIQHRSFELHYKRWQSADEPRAALLLVHGLAEHCGRYTALARRLTDAGVDVCALDLPGHGRSGGEPGHVERFDDMDDSVSALRDHMDHWYPGLPVFLLGHSMGGLIAVHTLTREQQRYAGCVLSGPALRSALEPPFLQMMFVRLLSAIAPRTRIMGLDPSGVSRDAGVVQDYIDDPLNFSGKGTARLVAGMFSTMARARAGATDISIPLLILHGGADSMTAPAGATELYENAAASDKTLKIYDGLYHEIFNEPEGPSIIEEVAQWLVARLPESHSVSGSPGSGD